MSFAASGTFRGEMEFRTGGGKTIVCGIRTPPSERSPFQQAQSQRFSEAIAGWRGLDAVERVSWDTAAQETPLTGYQLFISEWFTQDITPPDLPIPPA